MSKKIKLKIAVIGDPKSGKTCFIDNLLSRHFNPNYESTQQYEISIFKLKTGDIDYQIQLWQCGNNHMNNNKYIRSAFFKNCSAAFLTFDISNHQWMKTIGNWVEEAYQFDCFLVYAIGTKKNIFLQEKFVHKNSHENIPSQKLSDSLLEKSGVQTLDEMAINQFFSEFQIKHFYQSATDKLHPQIQKAFITIENDQHKLTRSSLAMGRRFDNTIVNEQSLKESEIGKKQSKYFFSVKEELFEK